MTHLEQAIRERRNGYMRKYRENNPWAKYYSYAVSRRSQLGIECTITVKDVRAVWFRDKASALEYPSIDRINPRKGYVPNNIRFIEEADNKLAGSHEFVRRDKIRRLARGTKCLQDGCEYITRSKYGRCYRHVGGSRPIVRKPIPRI